MNKHLTAVTTLLVLIFALAYLTTLSAGLTIGVKKDDWIEYQVAAVGSFPGEHNAKWVRMEIVDVQGEIILVNVTTQLTDESYVYYNETIDFDTGELLEGFFLPSNVTVGGSFYDSLVGNFPITGIEQRTYAGAIRTVLKGETPENTYYWDQETGMVVEARSSYPDFDYTLDTIVDKTNMWHPQIFGLEPTVFYLMIAAIAASIAVIAAATVIWRRKKVPQLLVTT